MTKLLKTTSAALLALAIVAAKPAFAEYNYFDNVYFAAGGGVAVQQGKLHGLPKAGANYIDIKRKNLGAYRAAIGTAIGDVRAEFEFLGLEDRKLSWSQTSSIATVVATKAYYTKLRSQAYLLNGYYDFKGIADIVTPYIGAGVGVAYNNVRHIDVSRQVDTDPSTLEGTISKKSSTDFAWQVGLGAKFDVAQNVFFDVNYRFLSLGKARANSVINLTTGATVDLGASAVKGKLYNHVFLASVGLKF